MKLKLVASALCFCAVFSVSASAQLSGTYTVGGAGTYATLALAVADLNLQGVSGPVSFVVAAGSEAGPFTINAFVGQGAANPVYFLGASTALTIATGTVLTINGQYVTFDGFTGSFTAGASIVIAGSFNTFKNCNFSMPTVGAVSANKIFSITGGTGHTVEDCTFGGGYEAFNSAAACSFLTFQRNRLQGGSFWVAQILGTDVIVRNNFIWGSSNFGLRAGAGTTNLRILNNSFYIAQLISSSQYCALRWYGTTYGEVLNNSFTDVHVNTTNGNILWCSGALAPTVMNYNTLNMVNGLGLISLSNIQQTLAMWQATGRDLNSSIGDPGYANTASTPPDLHIGPTSPNFLAGNADPNVVDDIDFQTRAPIPCRGADELPPPPLYAAFAVPPVTVAPCGFGPAAFTVNYVDQSASTDPGGITSWSWDLDGDSVPDSTLQNPSFTYNTPGIYSVTLTVTDAVNPPYTFTRVNLITAQPYRFRIITTGGGVGDLFISGIPQSQVPTAFTGYMFISLNTSLPVSTGPLFGIAPDALSWQILLSPANVGDIFHWIGTAGIFPNVGFGLPAPALAVLSGVTLDGVQVDITAAMTIAAVSNVSRATF